jgi:hypothetical protein
MVLQIKGYFTLLSDLLDNIVNPNAITLSEINGGVITSVMIDSKADLLGAKSLYLQLVTQ